MALYLDTETTGLRPPHDDLIKVALVDANGRRRIAGVCQPAERWMCRGWPEAQAIHGLAPEHVADAQPTDLIRGEDLVICNARFDLGFFDRQLPVATTSKPTSTVPSGEPRTTSAGAARACAIT